MATIYVDFDAATRTIARFMRDNLQFDSDKANKTAPDLAAALLASMKTTRKPAIHGKKMIAPGPSPEQMRAYVRHAQTDGFNNAGAPVEAGAILAVWRAVYGAAEPLPDDIEI